MPRRRPQEYEERRRQIIDGALRVFSTQGFVRATNKDIAAAAGINSPGLIYHYFQDKADLLRAVIEQYAPPIKIVANPDDVMALTPAEALTRLGLAYVGLVDDPNIGACMRLIMGEALREPEFAQVLGEIGPLRFWQFVATYLERQMDAGALRRADPTLMARCFVGPLALHLLQRVVFGFPDLWDVTPETLVAGAVEVFLHGLQPEG